MTDSNFIHPSISALINLSIGRISSVEVQKFLIKQGKTSLLLDQLKNKLIILKGFLADAESKSSSADHPVKTWLDDLQELMYDAENALDLIALQASRFKSLSKTSFKKVHRSIFSCIIPSDDRIDSEVIEILKRVDGLLEQASFLQLQDGKNRGQALGIKKLVVPKPKRYVGRDLEIKKLTDVMEVDRKDSDSIRVVLIYGVSGVGKTSLAQMLYDDERLDSVFDMKAWLGFQRDFDHLDVFKSLYEVMFENLWSSDAETIEKRLCGFIRGKKLLLVFDDVCFERFRYWEKLLLLISLGARGTTVIVTTCIDNPCSLMFPPPGCSFHLKPLSDDECWSIIKSTAFDQDSPLNENSEAIVREMATKCKGLPLLAVLLGGVLRSIPREIGEWEAILKSPDILRASYNNLYNPEIKLCFAYCSLFPRNYRFEREELILLWMAEGFLISDDTQTTPEELGNAYLNELVSRSFFQHVSANKETCFVMHNLVHDLAEGIFRGDETSNTRHFSYVQTKYHDYGKFQTLSNDKLRTFLAMRSISKDYFCYMPRKQLPDVFPKWSCLRVLSLAHYQIIKLPASVENIRHLRYLNLSYTRISKLPISIRKLYKLQTLLLSNCGRLIRLPSELGEVVSLRHLDISNTASLQEMPYSMSKLKDLQTLSKFVVGEERGARISELGQLQSLRGSLVISGLENVDSLKSVKAADIKGKVFLNELVYEWHNLSTSQTRVLDELKPNANLERLTIHGFLGTKFPDWVGAPEYHKMVALALTDCHSCISLPPLGQLSSLKHVSIEGFRRVVEVGNEFYGSNTNAPSFIPFLSLETMKFKEMCSWRKWNLFQGNGLAFPNLKELSLEFCPALCGDLPTDLPCLKKLDIRYYPELANSLPRLPSIRNLALKRCSLPDLQILTDLTSLLCLKIDTPGNSTWTNTLSISPSIESLETKHCNFETPCHAPSWLKSLTLARCRNLDLSSERYMNLRYLSLTGAESLTTFQLNLFTNLIYLEISSCHNLKSFLLPQEHTLESLHDLSISDCHSLVDFHFPSNDLPTPNLTRLTIENCPQIENFPSNGLPQSLLSLKVSTCNKLISNRRNWQLQNLASLKNLEIGGDEVETFPEDRFLLPTSLNKLSINGFGNLRSLNSEGINVLTSLEELKISGCPKLESLPEDLMLPSLCSVDFVGSALLELRCLRDKEDWPKISHLPRVHVSGREL